MLLCFTPGLRASAEPEFVEQEANNRASTKRPKTSAEISTVSAEKGVIVNPGSRKDEVAWLTTQAVKGDHVRLKLNTRGQTYKSCN